MIFRNTKSANATNTPKISTVTITTIVESISSFRVGQDDFFNSTVTSARKSRTLRNGFVIYCYSLSPLRHPDQPICLQERWPRLHRSWHARRDLNPQPTVLETVALPIELLAYPHHGLVHPESHQCLLGFAMGDMLPAFRTKLAQLQPLGTLCLLIPGRRVVATLALSAGHCDQLSRHLASAP
jgi:hypothetical protein